MFLRLLASCTISRSHQPYISSVMRHSCGYYRDLTADVMAAGLDIIEQPRSQTIEEGGLVTLKCVANARNGQLSYRWIHNRHELTSAGTRSKWLQLPARHVYVVQHTCTLSKTCADLYCICASLSDSDVSILKGELSIDRVSTRHGGDYMCIVELHDSQSGQVLATQTSKLAKLEVRQCICTNLARSRFLSAGYKLKISYN